LQAETVQLKAERQPHDSQVMHAEADPAVAQMQDELSAMQEQAAGLSEELTSLRHKVGSAPNNTLTWNISHDPPQEVIAVLVRTCLSAIVAILAEASTSCRHQSSVAVRHVIALEGKVHLQIRRVEDDKQAYIARCEELDTGLAALVKGMPEQALQRKYADAVSRMASMQMQHTSLAQQLGAATASENLLQVRKSLAVTYITTTSCVPIVCLAGLSVHSVACLASKLEAVLSACKNHEHIWHNRQSMCIAVLASPRSGSGCGFALVLV